VSFLAGVLVTLQCLLFGGHRVALGVCCVFERIGAGFSLLLSRGKEAEPTWKETVDDSPKSATDVAKDKVVGNEEKENKKQDP
jgi:hypothetical protein